MARRLTELPITSGAFAAGELSADQVTAVCRRAPAHADAEVCELARYATVTQLRRSLACYPLVKPAGTRDDDGSEAQPEPEPDELSFGHDDTGRWRLRADLAPELGAVVERALEREREAVFRLRHPDADADAPPSSGVTWADALVGMAQSALADPEGRRPSGGDTQVIVHIRGDEPGAPAQLHLGPAVPARVRRELDCDAMLQVVLEICGIPVAMGRNARIVPPRVRLLVEDRDQGCRGPACDQRRWLQIHHLVHWEDGGATDPTNLVALCPLHHRLHHQGLLGIEGDPTRPDGLRFTDAKGRPIPPCGRPRPPGEAPGVAARELGLRPSPYEHPTGERLDYWWVHFNEPPAS